MSVFERDMKKCFERRLYSRLLKLKEFKRLSLIISYSISRGSGFAYEHSDTLLDPCLEE